MAKIKVTFKSEIIIDTEKYSYDLTFDKFTEVYHDSNNSDHKSQINMYHDINDNIKCVKMEYV